MPARQGQDEAQGGRQHPAGEKPLDGLEFPRLVELLDVLRQFCCRLIAIVQARLEAARNDLLEGLGYLGDERANRCRCHFGSFDHFRDGALGALGTAASHQHVVEDETEGIEVGALVGDLPAKLLG